MKQKEIQDVVQMVAASQLKNIICTFEFDELVNEAIVAVLEAKKIKKVSLTEGLVATIARRRLIQWKLKNTDARSIPLNSAYRLYKNKDIAVPLPLTSESSDEEEKEDYVCENATESVYNWRREERLRDLCIVLSQLSKELTVMEKRLLRTLLNGGSGRELISELSKVHFPAVKRKTTEAFSSLRERFTECGY